MQELLKEVPYLYHRDKITIVPTRWLSLAGPGCSQIVATVACHCILLQVSMDGLSIESCQMLRAASDGSKREDDGGIQLSITEAYPQFSLNLCNV